MNRTYYKVDSFTGEMHLTFEARMDKQTAGILNYAHALNGSRWRLMTLANYRKTYL